MGVQGVYKGLQRVGEVTVGDKGLQEVTRVFRRIEGVGVTRGLRDLRGCRGCKKLQGVVEGYKGLQGVTSGYKGLQG